MSQRARCRCEVGLRISALNRIKVVKLLLWVLNIVLSRSHALNGTNTVNNIYIFIALENSRNCVFMI